MRKRIGLALALVSGLLMTAAPASKAASEIGSNCEGLGAAIGFTVVQLTKDPAKNPLPLEAPASGVITSWKVNMSETFSLTGYGERLKVLRPTGTPDEFQAVGESARGEIAAGQNVYSTRLPIQAGDHIGAAAVTENEAAFYCAAGPVGGLGAFPGEVPTGTTQTFRELVGSIELAIAAVIEPDADNDGYGDETQDKCPQSAATQAECPVVVVDAYPLLKKGSILVLVAVDEDAPVSVGGTVGLAKRRKAKFRIVSKDVAAGRVTGFKLKYPGNLRRALRTLPRGRKLTAKLTATAVNLAGQTSTDTAKLKLRGRR